MVSIRVWAVIGVVVLSVVGAGAFAGSGGVAAADGVVTLTVTVEDRDENPVQGAELVATWEDGDATATTASNGKAFLDVPHGANVSIAVDHDEYVRNAPYDVENATEREITVDVARQGELVIRASHDDAPVDDVDVVVRKDGQRIVSGETSADGEFETGVIEQGDYTVAVVKPGYYRQSHTVTVDGSVSRAVELDRGSVLLSIELADDYYEEPRSIEGARIAVGEIATVSTLGSGEAIARVPVNTRVVLDVSKEGYEGTSRSIGIRETDRNVSVTMNREPRLEAVPGNERIVSGEQVTVSVVDEYDDPVENATIRLDGDDVEETGDDGTASVRIEEVGEHEIVAVRDGLESEPVTVRAVADETETPTATPAPTSTPTATPFETPTPTPTEGGTAGFGIVLALVAVVVGVLLARRRS